MHAWILSKLFSSANILQQYVIASCLTKINSRLTHKILSKPFIDSLTMVKMETVKIICDPETPIHGAEAAADRAFLDMLHPFVDSRSIQTPITNLLEQATAAIANQPYEIYTDKTSLEFHAILLELLRLFKQNLAELLKCRQERSPGKIPSSFYDILYRVFLFGLALARIARGSAITTHLKTIQPSLFDHRRASVTPEEVSGQDGPELDTLHVEVQSCAVIGQHMAPLWMSYRDWLRLMVAHFDAVAIIGGHVTRPPPNTINEISIQILSPPCGNRAMLSWHKLLDSNYFPSRDVDSDTDEYETLQIISFLQEYSELNKPDKASPSFEMVIKAIRAHGLKNAADLADSVVFIDEQLQSLPCKSPSSSHHINDIISTLEKIRPEDPSESRQGLILDAIRMVGSLMDSSNLFRALRKLPLNVGENFPGRQHCEASLAAAITAADLKPTDGNGAFRDLVKPFQVTFIKL